MAQATRARTVKVRSANVRLISIFEPAPRILLVLRWRPDSEMFPVKATRSLLSSPNLTTTRFRVRFVCLLSTGLPSLSVNVAASFVEYALDVNNHSVRMGYGF